MLQDEAVTILGENGAERLKSFIQRIERLEEEKKTLQEDIKEVYLEAKGTGFCTKTMKAVIKLRKLEDNEIQEMDAMLETYRAALGLAADGKDEEE